MKTLLAMMLAPLCLLGRTSVYDVSMTLHVPVIVDNSLSLGKRVYRTQRLKGRMEVRHDGESEPEVSFTYLYNRSHRVNGRNVTYDVYVDRVLWHAVGSNRTGVFKKSSITLSIEATPSYALADGEDNTLILVLSGRGSSEKTVKGYASGQIGCGCYAYGHVSPTRIYGTRTVVDTAAAYGSWTIRKRMEFD